MVLQKSATRRHFTEAARIAAAEARRRKREEAIPRERPEVYVVRLPSTGLAYGWEIRRFGAVVIEKGRTGHATIDAARTAGERAMSDLPVKA